MIATPLPLPPVLALARKLTASHTALFGTRVSDVFHVAAALHLKSSAFLGFDTRQLTLARATGLAVP